MKTIFFLLNFILICFGQSPAGELRGTVSEYGTQTKLAAVSVMVKGTDLGASSDENGKYIIKNIPVGTYSIIFQYVGYKTYIQSDIIVKSGRITKVNTILSEDLYSADLVEVSSSYFKKIEDKPLSSISFSSEEIRRAPGSGGEVSRILSVMPSVATLGESSQDIMVRGGSPQENGFYIDNIPIPSVSHFQDLDGTTNGPTGIINSDLIENVDFHTGGFNASYGDRLSSIIDIKYREGSKEHFDTQIDFNLTGFGGNIEGPVSENASFFLSGRRSYIDIIADQIGEGAGVPRFSDIQAKLNYDMDNGDKITVLAIHGQSSVKQDIEDVIESKDNEVGRINNKQSSIGINWLKSFSEHFFSNSSVSFTYFDSHLSLHYSGLDNIHSKNELGAQFELGNSYLHIRNKSFLEINKTNKLEFGFDSRIEKSKYDYQIKERINQAGETSPEFLVKTDLMGAKNSAFLTYISNVTNKLTTTIGLRADQNSYNKDINFSPRFTGNYKINDNFSLNLSLGLYHQAIPNYFLSQNSLNKNLSDIKSVHQIIGFDYFITEGSKLTLEFYNKRYYDAPMSDSNDPAYLFDRKGGFPVGQLKSRGEAYSRGLELLYQKKLTDNFYTTISGSYFVSKYKDNSGFWRNRSFDSRYVFNAIAGYKLSNKWEFSARWLFQGALPTTEININESRRTGETIIYVENFNEKRLKSNHSLYIRADRRFQFDNSNLILYLSVWNAYARKNIFGKYWNPVKKEIDSYESFGVLPILGVEYEF